MFSNFQRLSAVFGLIYLAGRIVYAHGYYTFSEYIFSVGIFFVGDLLLVKVSLVM